MPLKMKGIEITTYVNPMEYRATIDLSVTNGILKWVKKLKTMDIAKNKQLRAR
jgi:hypothetical protein